MRAFAGGYYNKLRAMYDYLGVQYHPQRFLFFFSIASDPGVERTTITNEKPYFIHSSNNHLIPPIRPPGTPLFTYLLEIAYLLLCYLYFSLCCFLVVTRAGTEKAASESFGQYVRRIHLPEHFVSSYLLPLMSSVSTCSHEELLAFPAIDLIEYKRKTTGAQHYVVSEGVRDVQRKLSKELDIRLGSKVVDIEPGDCGVRIRWLNQTSTSEIVALDEQFGKVVLAVSPSVVAAVFEPLRNAMLRIPTKEVTSVVHNKTASRSSPNVGLSKSGSNAQIINFRSSHKPSPRTESRHVQNSNTVVTTCPLQPIDPSEIIQETTFTRVLRTPESRQICNSIFGRRSVREEGAPIEKAKRWRNGDGGVWLVGGWCWDGMVLLEGCIVSATRVAEGLGVEVPWRGAGL